MDMDLYSFNCNYSLAIPSVRLDAKNAFLKEEEEEEVYHIGL